MFCEYCGRGIPEDSVFCAYCGVKLPSMGKELDWEEAARLREMAERSSSVPPSEAYPKQYAQGCVAPGAPKKKCGRCGKNLPASTIGDYCALCEMRREREAETRRRKAEEAQYQQDLADDKRDRYDISDEFDWRAYRSETPASSELSRSGWKGKRGEIPPFLKKGKFVAVAAVLLVAVALFLPGIIGMINFAIIEGTRESTEIWESEEAAAIPVPLEEEESQWEPYEDQVAGWSERAWATGSTAGEAYVTWVQPLADWSLTAFLPELGEPLEYLYLDDSWLQWETDGILNRVTGQAVCSDANGDEILAPFDVVLVAVGEEPGRGYALCFEANGDRLLNALHAVDAQGYITQAGSTLFDHPVGTYPGDLIPRYLALEP